jgi:hypothetical protein
MARWEDMLKQWRTDRNITSPSNQFVSMIQEELQEYKDAKTWNDKVDAICDALVFVENQRVLENAQYTKCESLQTPESILQEYKFGSNNSHIFTCLRTYFQYILEDELNVIPKLAMKVCVKYILQRKQDPQQAKEWEQLKAQGKQPADKWKKDPNQYLEPPDYSTCKIKGKH